MIPRDLSREWLEADGLGGFASSTASLIRTRRYHALLQVATTPPTGRMVLVDGFEAWIEYEGQSIPLSSQMYGPDVVHPDGHSRIVRFESEPWPHWVYRVSDMIEIELELFVPHRRAAVALRWRVITGGAEGVRLFVRPLLSGRDHHSLHHENPAFRSAAQVNGDQVEWRSYDGVPAVTSLANAIYRADPAWYRNFLFLEEQARGLDDGADLASPGILEWDLSAGDAVWILEARSLSDSSRPDETPQALHARLRSAELNRRNAFDTPLDRAADAYLVRRGSGQTIVAGYPWFTDWGRDTLIALRGLCLATGRLDDARSILLEWASAVDQGMLPNRFVDRGDAPEFNSVDASLWYVIAVYDYRQALAAAGKRQHPQDKAEMDAAIEAILTGYSQGTRYGIRADQDGLLFAGAPGVQLTWMDAKVGDWVVTPRSGKPVEIQALWLNALRIAGARSSRWKALYEKGKESFARRFWHPAGYLHDVVDVEGQPGMVDSTFRPNQILAVGGLPFTLIDGPMAKAVVDAVEERLLTPLGLRSLAPEENGYRGRYMGGVLERDGSYHQGTVWPWLLGPFVEAWLRVNPECRSEARQRFLDPLLAHLEESGLGHVSEITDGDTPFTPRGCPFQAWSVSELIRLDRVILPATLSAPSMEREVAHAG